MQAMREEKRYTYSDYCAWDDDERWELIDGIPYAMSPAPSRRHQRILLELAGQIREYLKDKTCELYIAPFDVRLSADGYDDTVVQPDIIVVCDESKLDEKGCVGAPDLIIEVLSPSTSARDRVTKLNKYLQAGVREYWIVDPESKSVSTHILKDEEYVIRAYLGADAAAVHILDNCEVNLPDVFRE